MARARVGDVVRTRFQWGRLPSSVHHKCPVCRAFLKRGITQCSCGAQFDYINADFAQVTRIATP